MKTERAPGLPRTLGEELSGLPVLPHPSLIVDAPELEAQRAKRNDPAAERIFSGIQADMDRFMDPEYKNYLDHDTLRNTLWRSREGAFKIPPAVEGLSFVYAVTDDRRYAELARDVVFAVIRNGFADGGSGKAGDVQAAEMENYKGWRRGPDQDFGKFSHALAIFYDLCYETLTDDERREFISYAEECLTIAYDMQTLIVRHNVNNRGSRCALGNGLLALAVHGEADFNLVRCFLRVAIEVAETHAYFAYGIDGAPFEGQMYGGDPHMLITFGRALARRGCRDFSKHWNIREVHLHLLYTVLPTRDAVAPINDCISTEPRAVGALAIAAVTGNPVARWVYDKIYHEKQFSSYGPYVNFYYFDPAITPVSPAAAGLPLSRHFRERGLVCLKSGWEKEDAMATFYSGRQQWACHRQDDQNSFIFFALGERFAWDGGYGTDTDLTADHQFRRTEVHNAILVDGGDQNGYAHGRWLRGVVTTFRDGEDHAYALGDARRCYGINGSIERADRHLYFKRRPFPYLVVVDDVVVDGTPHDVTWNFVTNPGNRIDTQTPLDVVVQGVHAKMRLVILADGEARSGIDQVGLLPRYQATRHGSRVRFAALLLPLATGIDSSALEAAFEDQETRVNVTINDAVESFTFETANDGHPG